MIKSDQDKIFNQWLADFRPLLFKIVRIYAPTRADDNDLFQEIVIQVWRSIKSYTRQSSEHTWVYRVALNTAIKWSSRKTKTNHEELNDELLITPTSSKPNEKLDWLYQEISKLGKVEKSLSLLMLDGFSYKEMSDILGISTNHVGVKISRIKKHLQEKAKNIKS